LPIRLLHRPDTLERKLAENGLARFTCEEDWFLYGCGLWDPGEDFHLMLRQARAGRLLGTVGLTVEEDSATDYTPEDRERIGHLLQHASPINTVDDLSASYMLHYACNAHVGGHPAWLAVPHKVDTYKEIIYADELPVYIDHGWGQRSGRVVVRDNDTVFRVAVGVLGPAIAAALEGQVCVLYLPPHAAGGRNDRLDRHLLTRFAHAYDLSACLASNPEELSHVMSQAVAGELPVIPFSTVRTEKEKAKMLLHRLVEERQQEPESMSVTGSIAACLAPEGESVKPAVLTPGDQIPELVIGATFDPDAHYTSDYFGEGRGLRYTRPDGSKDIYKGPARHWGGFLQVARILSGIVPEELGRKYMSLGCGYGDDVRVFKEAGWDAYGVDLSEAAVAGASDTVKDRVLWGNVMDPAVLADVGGDFSMIVSFDFWEHIWEDGIPPLIKRVHELLKPGGIHFNVICTRGDNEKDYIYKPGVQFTKENSWLLAAGHVNIRRWSYWLKAFAGHGFAPDFATSYLFQVARSENAGLRSAASWAARNTVVVKKRKG
jgi:SAM-dependent methyltransferase